MKHQLLSLILLSAIPCLHSSAQNLLNHYEDLTGEAIFGYSINGNQTYFGEF
jgi:hypothetical protein